MLWFKLLIEVGKVANGTTFSDGLPTYLGRWGWLVVAGLRTASPNWLSVRPSWGVIENNPFIPSPQLRGVGMPVNSPIRMRAGEAERLSVARVVE